MRMKYEILFVGMLLLIAGTVTAVDAFNNPVDSSFSNNPQYYQPTFNELYSGSDTQNYWPILRDLENDQCEANSDFVIGIPPGGCSPSVVRSDLLAEQDVPVFCQLYAIKINPLIKVSSIRSISFNGDYPEGVKGISYHPARAAVNSYRTLLGDPVLNNIGYVVIILDREANESNLEKNVAGKLTARIRYDADDAYGASRSEYYLNVLSEDDWQNEHAASAFFGGRGFARLESSGGGEARVGLYIDPNDAPYRTFTLKEGETSNAVYFPGYYCRAGLKVKLNDFVGPEDSVLLNMDGQESWVREGTKFFDSQCTVRNIDIAENKTQVSEISGGSGSTSSSIIPKAQEKTTDQCREDNARMVWESARNYKQVNSGDYNIPSNIARNFECLALQVAMAESTVTHCGDQRNDASIINCKECEEDFSNVIVGGDGKSTGIMQVNKNNGDNTGEIREIRDNIANGLRILRQGYRESGREFECEDVKETYSGWERALRSYNGWGCIEGDAGVVSRNYVDKVIEQKSIVENKYPDLCGTSAPAEVSSKKETSTEDSKIEEVS